MSAKRGADAFALEQRNLEKGRNGMKAGVWYGKGDGLVDNAPDPTIKEPGDVMVKITSPPYAVRICMMAASKSC